MRTVLLVLLLLAYGASYAAPQRLDQTPRVDPQKQADGAIKGESRPREENQHSQSPVTGASATVPMPVPERPSLEAERKAEEDAKRRAEEASEYWSLFGRRLKITDSLLALFTLALVLIGAWQGSHLGTSVNLAREEFAATHRPRMRVRHVQFGAWLEADKPVKVTIISTNIGESPAKVIEFDAVTHIVPNDRHFPQLPFGGRAPQSPKQILPAGVRLEQVAASTPLIIEDLQDLYAKTHKLICFAYIDYLDMSGESRPRRTSCCRVFVPDPYPKGRKPDDRILKGSFAKFESEYEYED